MLLEFKNRQKLTHRKIIKPTNNRNDQAKIKRIVLIKVYTFIIVFAIVVSTKQYIGNKIIKLRILHKYVLV